MHSFFERCSDSGFMAAIARVLLFAVYLCLFSGCAAIGAPSVLQSFELSKLYQPLPYPVGDWNPEGLEYEDAWFSASDGTRLHGWYVPCQNPEAVVLFAHGNAGNVSNLGQPLREFRDRHRLAVMVFDYRGYGRSEGTPSENGLLQDARAAREWLANRSGINQRHIVLMGRSLGGAIMVDLAAKDGARALILESTFTSVPDVARHHLCNLPVHWIMASRFDSLSKIDGYHGPLLMSHGDSDEFVPYTHGVRMFQAANEPKRFVTIHGGNHNSPQSDEYHQALADFIHSLPQLGIGSPLVGIADRFRNRIGPESVQTEFDAIHSSL